VCATCRSNVVRMIATQVYFPDTWYPLYSAAHILPWERSTLSLARYACHYPCENVTKQKGGQAEQGILSL
jgi:hypothetical protein